MALSETSDKSGGHGPFPWNKRIIWQLRTQGDRTSGVSYQIAALNSDNEPRPLATPEDVKSSPLQRRVLDIGRHPQLELAVAIDRDLWANPP